MNPNQDALYSVLREWAVQRKVDSYTALSQAYQARTGDWFEPHGSWDDPLGELNRHLHHATGAPALSALVVLKNSGEPGAKFWACSPNVPARPNTELLRLTEWSRIVAAVHAYTWPVLRP